MVTISTSSRRDLLATNRAAIYMDNAPCHNGIESEFTDRAFKRLPPYSSFLNHSENCFSMMKANVKRQLNNISGRCGARAAHRQGTTLQRN